MKTIVILCIALFVVACEGKPTEEGNTRKEGQSVVVAAAAGENSKAASFSGGKDGSTYGISQATAQRGVAVSSSRSQSIG